MSRFVARMYTDDHLLEDYHFGVSGFVCVLGAVRLTRMKGRISAQYDVHYVFLLVGQHDIA